MKNEKMKETKEKALKRIEELKQHDLSDKLNNVSLDNNVDDDDNEDVNITSKHKLKEQKIKTPMFIPTNESLELQKEIVNNNQNQKLMMEISNQFKDTNVLSERTFDKLNQNKLLDWSSDDDDDDDDDDNWLLPSYARSRLKNLSNEVHDEEDELTTSQVDAAGMLLEKGDT